MKKVSKINCLVIALVIIAFLFCGCSAVKNPNEENEIDLSNMKLVFEDNFDTEIDKSTWDTTAPTLERRGGYWDPDQCFVKDGNLIIRTEYKEDGKYGAGWYTGTCRSKDLKEFKYGYYEVRCKVPSAQGLWSAFWMTCDSMGDVTDGGKNGCEIDIMESPYYNDPKMPAEKYRNTTMHTLHIDGYGKEHKSRMSKQYQVQNDMYNEYNTYGLLWSEDEYVFYINGKETWRTSWGVSQVPEYLWLSVEIAGEAGTANPSNPDNKYTFAGEIEKNENKTTPYDFEVDYVRVYQFN